MPSTEKGFLKRINQFYHFNSSLIQAKDIVFSKSSVSNKTAIKNIINRMGLKRDIILGIRLQTLFNIFYYDLSNLRIYANHK